MQKRKVSIEEFKTMWYNMVEDDLLYTLSPDDIEDDTLRGLFNEAVALNVDRNEVLERIDRYINDTGRRGIFGPRDADPEQPTNVC